MTRPLLALLLGLGLAAGEAATQEVTSAPGGVLRALDKLSGETLDLEVPRGGRARVGTLEVVMIDCRFPAGNPAGNAFAALEISEQGKEGTLFSGWMIAASPALSALEHARYDVWVMRCSTS